MTEVEELRLRVAALEEQNRANEELYTAFQVSMKVSGFVFTYIPKLIKGIGSILIATVIVWECYQVYKTGVIPTPYININN